MPRSTFRDSSPQIPLAPSSPTRLAGGVLVIGVIIMIGVVSTFGPSAEIPQSLVNLLIGLLTPAPLLAGVYMLAGLGYAKFFEPLCRWMPLSRCVSSGAGLAALLTFSHLMGCLGLLKPATRNLDVPSIMIVWAPVIVGVVLLVIDLVQRAAASRSPTQAKTQPRDSTASGLGSFQMFSTFKDARYLLLWMATPSLAILFVAGTFAPGYLWDSEFGGYDALSYHLQLPQEWLAAGVLTPLKHNVYSFLPGYIESAFMHLGALSFAPEITHATNQAISHATTPSTTTQMSSLSVPASGLAAGTGWRLIACQYLHIYFTLFAAYVASRTAYTIAIALKHHATDSSHRDHGHDDGALNQSALLAGFMCFAIVVTTPWTIAVGSLAYNEMAMLAFFACAVAATCGSLILRLLTIHNEQTNNYPKISPLKTTALCAILIGAAVCAKPTALFFCGIPIALLLCLSFPLRTYPKMAVIGVLIGTLMLAPWLIRNAVATQPPSGETPTSGVQSSMNPVFPFAASLFPNSSGGTGHWTAEQVQRFNRGHSFNGTLTQAIALTVRADPNDPMGRTHRGMFHHQWFLFFPVILVGLMVGAFVCSPATRLLARILLACIAAQYVIWLTLTHVQSRFLLPLMIPGAIGLAVIVSDMRTEKTLRWSTRLATLFVTLQAMAVIAIFASQRNGDPNLILGFPGSWRNAEVSREVFVNDPTQLTSQLLMNLPPEQLMALTLEPDAKVTMIGGATPLYMTRETQYNTTWDAWVNLDELAAAARASDSPHYVLVDFSEIARLMRSGIIQPGMNSDAITRWLTEHAQVIKTWEEIGTVLARVRS